MDDLAPPRMGTHEWLAILAAMLVGIALLVHTAWKTGATYDEVTYLEVAANWWRTGDQAAITRMGSPQTFWKLQYVPVFAVLDAIGRREVVDQPIPYRTWLLPIIRVSSSWIWLAAFAFTVLAACEIVGPCSAPLAAWLFAVSPNLVAHAALATMEMPLIACVAASLFAFARHVRTRSRASLVALGVAVGVGFSCKFTMAVIAPLALVLLLVIPLTRRPVDWRGIRALGARALAVMAIALTTNLLLTGFSVLPLSEQVGEHPFLDRAPAGRILATLAERRWPSDWVGFLTQMRHQASGGPSYLLGERRMNGWWYYYPVALAVKLPLGLLIVTIARLIRRTPVASSASTRWLWMLPLLFLALAMIGSKRNYGIRYLLPTAPLTIVWLSGAAQSPRPGRLLAWTGVATIAIATFAQQPHLLSFFNQAAGGTSGGRRILADSNLDWGQGSVWLAKLQRDDPRLNDLTLYQFGEADPSDYGVRARIHMVDAGTTHPTLPPALTADTRYVAVSASLQWGPWGPDNYFAPLQDQRPVAMTDDGTIAVYETPPNVRATSP